LAAKIHKKRKVKTGLDTKMIFKLRQVPHLQLMANTYTPDF